MRAVIQRVGHASVTIEGIQKSAIKEGYLILLGVCDEDTIEDVDWLVRKIAGLRVFNDENGVMNLSITEIGGNALVISQFTLFASYKKGNRPSWFRAGSHEHAIPLYETFCSKLSDAIGKTVGSGEFGADMKVELLNDGPVTICMDTKNKEWRDEEISLGNRVVRHHIDIDWSCHFIGDRLSVWRMALRHRTITMGSRSGLQSFPLDGICQRKQTEHQYYGAGDPHSTHTNDMEDITIKEAQEAVDRWIKTYGVRYFSELTNMAVLTEEVGELARIIARKYGDQSFKPGEKDDLGDEMADVLWVLICLANQTGVDLTEELKKNLEKKTKRDKERHINNQKLK